MSVEKNRREAARWFKTAEEDLETVFRNLRLSRPLT
jgi:hypothetical protein